MTDAGYDFWNREVHDPSHVHWMALPEVREWINRRVSGDPAVWPLDWFARVVPGRRFARALSVGCGAGALERDLVERGLVDRVDAFDGSLASLAVARSEAARAGRADRIRYFAADFNRPALPRAAYDAVFVHQALHHVAKLEKLLRAIRRALKPDGLLYLEEYVGPSSNDWDAATLAPYAAIYAALPREIRRSDRLLPPVEVADPSEAIRSAEIREQLRVGFHVEQERGYGGNLLSTLLPSLDLERAGAETVRALIAREAALLAAGEPDFYAVIVARPLGGLAGRVADLRYFLEPKLRRAGRELGFGR